MKMGRMILLLTTGLLIPTALSAQEAPVDGSAAAIRKVVSGQTCVGDDVLVFGKSTPGSGGTFERKGSSSASYDVGYGTILIRRGPDLHGHVTSVSVPDRVLHMSVGTYRCRG